MKFVTRKELGWGPSAAPHLPSAKGVKIHYEGGPVKPVDHSQCAGQWKAIRNAHLSNTREHYSDVAYNLAVCNHGYVFEGRGIGRQTGANGNQTLNKGHYAILWMGGTAGVTIPSADAVEGIKEAIQYLRAHGAGKEIKGHRDGYATACPGNALYALVLSGALEPGKAAPAPKPAPELAPYPGKDFFHLGRVSPLITAMGRALVAAGYKGYKIGPSPIWGPGDRKAIQWFQQKQGWTGPDADGYPGSETWRRLRVRKP